MTPVNVAWSMRNRTPMIRIPDRRDLNALRARIPDPAANPYLALAVRPRCRTRWYRDQGGRARAGEHEHLGDVSPREAPASHRRPAAQPRGVGELEKDTVIKEALGEHIYSNFLAAKREEWKSTSRRYRSGTG